MYVFLVAVVSVLIFCKFLHRNHYKFPRGPFPFPLVGNLFQLGSNPPVQFSKWVAKYGKVYTIYIGRQPALVVSDPVLMKQIFGKPESTGNYATILFKMVFLRGGLAASSGAIYQEQRSFFVKCLKKLESSPRLEAFVNHEVAELVDWFDDKVIKEESILLPERLKAFSSNIMWAFLTGTREETNISRIMERWVQSLNRATSTGVTFISLIGKIAPVWSGMKEYRKCCNQLKTFCKNSVELERKAENQIDSDSESILESYLQQVESTISESSSFYGESGYDFTVDALIGMMLGGAETTATTLNWLLFYMCTCPDIQNKLQQDVDQIGGEICLADRKRLTYAEAVIEETLRMASTLPMGLIHVLENDLVWNEWKFPKGMLLIPNIYHVHNDPSIWGDPEVFRPERFLDSRSSTGRTLKDCIMSFQVGRRICPGTTIARDVLLLSVCNLIRQFSFHRATDLDSDQYLAADVGYLSVPKLIPIVVKKR